MRDQVNPDETEGKIVKATQHLPRTLLALAMLVACLGALALCASNSLAARNRIFGGSFGSPGSGAGQLALVMQVSEPLQGALKIGGSGVAVNESTHDIYVADTGNNRVDQFTAAGEFVQAWGWGVENGASEFQICTEITGCQAGIAGTSPGQFESPTVVAVDNSLGGEGNVYVSNYSGFNPAVVQKFTASGSLIESWGTKGQIGGAFSPPIFSPIKGMAILSGHLLVNGKHEFDRNTGEVIVTQPGEPEPEFRNGIAVDGAGNLYFQIQNEVLKFDSSGQEIGIIYQIQAPPPPGFGVSAATGIASSLSGEVYVDEGNAIDIISPSCVSLCAPSTRFTSPQLTEGAGIAVDSNAETVYIAEISADKVESIILEPPSAPTVEPGTSAEDVTGESATLEGEIDSKGAATSYRFEYGLCTTSSTCASSPYEHSMPVPDGLAGAGFETHPVSVHVQGLVPGSSYHYRIVASNEINQEVKTTEGEELTFATQLVATSGLPDGRAWELVSPSNKYGARLLPPEGPDEGGDTLQSSVDGDAIAYRATAPTESGAPGNTGTTQVLSTRGAASWTSLDISPPREATDGANLVGAEYVFFSSDLSVSAINPFGPFQPSLSNEASEQTAFLHEDFPAGDPAHLCIESCYHPLVTGAPGFANVPEGLQFGTEQFKEYSSCTLLCGPQFLGATADGSHVVLNANAELVEGAPAGSLYEWTSGHLTLVSVLPESQGGEPAPASASPMLGYSGNNPVGLQYVAHNAISDDGSRVVWSTLGSGTKLYLRDLITEETVQLGGMGAQFLTASSDDSRVFFQMPGNGDISVFEAAPGSVLSAGHTTDLTPGGAYGMLASSEDGSTIYFVAQGDLTGAETNGYGEAAVVGQPNLYMDHSGEIKLIAGLSKEDNRDWEGLPELNSSRVSPDGQWVGFMSDRSLTGYDNRDSASGMPDEEVFLYHDTGSSGSLVCASCDPTGARPHGVFDVGAGVDHLLVDSRLAWAHRWLAGNVPVWLSPFEQPRYLSDLGRLFFDSSDALVPSDTNGVEDAYEYEPPGVGDCVSESVTFSSRSDGCVSLISSGTSKEESAFIDASESGDDVFFMTFAQLTTQDTDSAADFYDARVDGGFPTPPSPPACEGDACQSPVAAPNDPTPGSLTYHGPGNPLPTVQSGKGTIKKTVKCPKAKELSHGRCIKRKRRQRASKARKAISTNHRRGA